MKISSSRETSDGDSPLPAGGATSGRRPAKALTTSARRQARGGEVVVHRVEQVRDVLALDGRRHLGAARVVGVGRADERVLVPRDHEHHAPVLHRVQHDRRLVADARARHDDVHALGRTEPRRPRLVDARSRRRPTGRPRSRPRAPAPSARGRPAGPTRARRRRVPPPSRSRSTRAYETATAPASRAESSVSSTRRASSVQQSQYSPAPRRPSRAQRRLVPARRRGAAASDAAATFRMPARRSYAQSPAASFHVPDRAVGVDRIDEAHRSHEMRRQPAQALALARRLEHEPDLALLEVAQAAVDQLRRAARGARTRSRTARPARPGGRAAPRRARCRRR